MPTLQLKLSPPQNTECLAALAGALTRLSTEHLGKRAEVTAVMIDQTPAEHWYVAGREVERATAWLEISITAGTNTAEEKAIFIGAAFAELERQLGSGQALQLATYVLVRELPMTDWGYGGKTQQVRKLAQGDVAGSASLVQAK